MRSPAAAIAWELRRRHRWGLLAVAAYLLGAATIRLLVLDPGVAVDLGDGWRFALVVVVPLAVTVLYVLAVFTFGFEGDLAGRASLYPARMFTLPVTSAALAGWPMLYGTAAIVVLWLAIRLVGVWPPGFDVPVIWPAVLGASFLAWTQALTWMPYGLPGLRVILAMLWLSTIDAIVLLALHNQVPEFYMVAFLAPQVPLAFLAARSAVARARRGEVPDWRGAFAWLPRIGNVLTRRPERFASPERAQLWFEWRRHGRSLPALVGALLPFELALLFVAGNAPGLVFLILLAVLLTPPFLAGFAGATASRANPHVRDSLGLAPFLATRPLTSGALIVARLKAAAGSTLVAWLLVLAAIPLALVLSGTWPLVSGSLRRVTGMIGTPRATVIALLLFAGLLSATWNQLVQTLYVGLTGREWVIRAQMGVLLAFLCAVGPVADWILRDAGVRFALWEALPWILAVPVALKTSAAAWVAIRLHHSRLLDDRTLVAGAAGWLALVLALWALLVWLAATPFIPTYFLGLIAILSIPLARVSAAPLALAWNRHR